MLTHKEQLKRLKELYQSNSTIKAISKELHLTEPSVR